MKPRSSFPSAAIAALASFAPVLTDSNDPKSAVSTIVAFAPHEGCRGERLGLRVGTKVLDCHACQGDLDAGFLEFLRDFGMFLENLPVEKLDRITIANGWIDLDFVGKKDFEFVLRGGESLALQPRDSKQPLVGGRVFRNEAEDLLLSVDNVVRLERDGSGRILGVRHGDIRVKKGLWLDVDLRTSKALGRTARDANDRILLVRGPDGDPLRDGQGHYVPQIYDCWVLVEVDTLFKDVKVALGVPPTPETRGILAAGMK